MGAGNSICQLANVCHLRRAIFTARCQAGPYKSNCSAKRKISVQRNRINPDEYAMKRIEAEIERIMMLREGAFRPWYELPLLRSFGGAGTLVVVLQYFAGVWGSGTVVVG